MAPINDERSAGLGRIRQSIYTASTYFPLPRIARKAVAVSFVGSWGDSVGYEVLVDYAAKKGLSDLPGDFVEIGSFVGGGTAKLARFAHLCGKRVYAVDIFDIKADETLNMSGKRMNELYESYLQSVGMNQWEAYCCATRRHKNIVTLPLDSKKVRFSKDVKFAFGFIDGNHTVDYIINDFGLVWRNLVSGGAVGFHDYRGDLPSVTTTIDSLMHENRDEIADISYLPNKWIVLLSKT